MIFTKIIKIINMKEYYYNHSSICKTMNHKVNKKIHSKEIFKTNQKIKPIFKVKKMWNQYHAVF